MEFNVKRPRMIGSVQALGVCLAVLVCFPGCAGPKHKSVAGLPEPALRARPRPRPVVSAPVVVPYIPAPAQPAPAAPPPPGAWRGPPLPRDVWIHGNGNGWQYIVIHHSATDSGSAGRFDGFHRAVKGWDELGYHFVIGNGHGSRDGEIEVGSRWPKQKHGAHCKTPDNRYNLYGIGICLVGDFARGAPPTSSQMVSLETLVRHLMTEFHIPAARVLGHGDVTQRTECPGQRFPIHQLRNRLASVAISRTY